MFRFFTRPRAFAALPLISAVLLALAFAGPHTAAAHPMAHGVPQGPLVYATAAERGDAAAEAAIDALTRALSRERGYQPNGFTVDLYTMPAVFEDGLVQGFADAYANDGWAAAPELSTSGRTYTAAAWTSHGGANVLVVGYGYDTTGDLFVTVIQAAR